MIGVLVRYRCGAVLLRNVLPLGHPGVAPAAAVPPGVLPDRIRPDLTSLFILSYLNYQSRKHDSVKRGHNVIVGLLVLRSFSQQNSFQKSRVQVMVQSLRHSCISGSSAHDPHDPHEQVLEIGTCFSGIRK